MKNNKSTNHVKASCQQARCIGHTSHCVQVVASAVANGIYDSDIVYPIYTVTAQEDCCMCLDLCFRWHSPSSKQSTLNAPIAIIFGPSPPPWPPFTLCPGGGICGCKRYLG